MKLSEDLVQGLALGEEALSARCEQVADALMLAEDKEWIEMSGSVLGTMEQGEPVVLITFPANISREDFERMKAEIMAALQQAEFRGERKALAFLMGEGSGTPVGIVKRSELNDEPLETNDNTWTRKTMPRFRRQG